LYFVAVVASIFAETAYLHTPPTLTSIASHLFILQGLSIETVTSLNGPLWTMGIDLGFYLALPFVALGLRRLLRDRSRSVRIRVVLGTILAVAAASLAYRYVGYLTHPVAAKDINADLVYVRNVFGYACSFMIGVGVALAMVTGVRISRFAAIGFVIAGIVLATLDARGVDGVELKLLRVTLLDPILALSVACVLFGAAQHPSRLVTRIVSAKVVTTAAALSYGIYLFHWPLIECLDTFWLHGNSGNDPFMKLTLVTFAIILPLAFVLNRLIEVPILAMRDRNRAPGIAAVPAPAPKSIAQKLPESVSPNLTASS
jgi:peptidoglycan/LPS O-acetylase OafA/YrhL